MFRKVRRLSAIYLPPRARYCVICNRRVFRYVPYRNGLASQAPLMRALQLIGSDVVNFACPSCGAHDRERHLLLYMRASGLFDELPKLRILHFAPEAKLTGHIAGQAPQEHVKCDLFPTTADVQRVDLLAMPFANASFDLVIANHVLEHVDDDRRALAEIVRVLAPEGRAILQTPYSPMLTRTWEDANIRDESARLQAFGQEDHVRLYGSDIFARFESAGLASRVRTHAELLAQHDAYYNGVNAREPFFLFQRTPATE
jgi:SAM-dependent methyltransferase